MTVYRKQTDHPLSQRVHIGGNGEVTITDHGKLYLNMSGAMKHTVEFGSDSGQIVSYDIPKSYRDSIHENALPQNRADHPDGSAFTRQEWKALLKEYPKISDPTNGPHLYGIPDKMLDGLRDAIIPGSGRVVQKGEHPQMMHSSDSLAEEFQRLRERPNIESAPPVLSLFVVDASGDAAEYEQRLRSILSPAVRLGATADFEQESLPVDDVPVWFAAVSSGDEERTPQFARAGHEGYVEHTGGGRPWEMQDWLYRFDPDGDSRGWEWWDATPAGPSRVHIWVDSW